MSGAVEDYVYEEDDDRTHECINASQVHLSPISTQAENELTRVSDSIDGGVIEKILLVDFMCHARYEVQLNPSVNFILGQNGSGKSAIMTAIIVALGGKATATQRGSSLKSFIRTGCSQAEIHLTLFNKGSEAYKPTEYGYSITVIRTIKSDGTTAYKLKSHNGHIVSRAKEELLRIRDQFNIQVDNPVCMLSQDTSRHFLHSSQPGAKFKLFMKGTHLEQMSNDYALAKEQQELMKHEIARKKEMLPLLQKNAKQFEEILQDIEQLKTLESKEHTLTLEFMWAVARELEERADELERQVLKEKEKLQHLDDKIDKSKKAELDKQKENEEARSILQEATKEISTINLKRDELLEQKRSLEREVRDMEKRQQAIQRNRSSVNDEKHQFELKLLEVQNLNHNCMSEQRDALRTELESKEAELSQCKQKLECAQRDYDAKEKEKQAVDESYSLTQSSINQVRQQIKECEDMLQKLTLSDNPLNGYANWMSELVQTLRQNKQQFSQLPKGPIGAYIKVKEQQWCFAIECAIGFGNLCGFLVDNHDDEFKFKRIVRDVLKRHPNANFPSCLKSRFLGRVYDVSRNMPQCSYPSLVSMLSVSDPDIMNILIDMCNIDTTILITRKDEARQVMSNPPHNAKSAYTIDGDQVLPNSRYYSNRVRRPYGILRASKEESIAQQNHCIEQLKTNLMDYRKEEEKNLAKQQNDIKGYITSAKCKSRELRKEIDELRGKIEELDDINQEVDRASWESEINELKTKLANLDDNLNQLKTMLLDKRNELSLKVEEIQKHTQHSQNVVSKIEEYKASFKMSSENLRKAERNVNDYKERRVRLQNKLNETTNKWNGAKKDVEISVHTAETHCNRICTQRPSASIQIEIDEIKKKLLMESNRRADQEEARKNYVEAMEQFEATDAAIKKEEESLVKLESSLQMRIVGYDEIRSRLAGRACLYFSTFVRRRGYSGTLKFDFHNHKLDLIVKVNKEQATKNIRSLSGGERSFATVAFIMALWEAMESPFRCLDEFDVFMDLINRRISMQLMLEGSEILPGKQFIFFTPQDMSSLGIKYPERCKILRLEAPDRTQRTLD